MCIGIYAGISNTPNRNDGTHVTTQESDYMTCLSFLPCKALWVCGHFFPQPYPAMKLVMVNARSGCGLRSVVHFYMFDSVLIVCPKSYFNIFQHRGVLASLKFILRLASGSKHT